MKIEIPENTKVFGEGATCMHPLCSMQRQLDIAVRIIKKKYRGRYPIDDLEAFELGSWVRVVTNLRSFVTICLLGEDYNSCCTLARSIADSICALRLIYQSTDLDEVVFRHYLYVLDGINERLKLLPEEVVNNGRITDAECNALRKQCEVARKNSKGIIFFCKNKLEGHSYCKSYPRFVEIAILGKKFPWKYVSPNKMKHGKIEEYSWKQLYSMLDSRESIITMYSGYLSQFVHGLAISCVAPLDDEDNFDSIASIGVCLQGYVKQRLDVLIGAENIRKNTTNEDIAYMLSLYSPEKVRKIMEGFNESNQD